MKFFQKKNTGKMSLFFQLPFFLWFSITAWQNIKKLSKNLRVVPWKIFKNL